MQHKLIVFIVLFIINCGYAEEIKLPTHVIHIYGEKHFDEATIQSALSVETKSIFAFWKEDIPRIKDKLIPTLEATLESFYDSEGFYDATFNIKETNTTVDVRIKENKPVLVSKIHIESDYTIKPFILPKKGHIFRAKDFIATKSAIIENLLNKGYCSYQLDTKAYVDLDKHQADLNYVLKKGEICTFGKANIKGLKTIDKDVILSRLRAKEGERFDSKKVKETYSGIYALNSFDSVKVNVDRKIYNVVPIDITLHEVEAAYHFEGGVGYDTYIGPRVHASIIK
ncbi:MAG TPA: outer membrane protein assembly factor, partial [Epsilonproteobacteria bacterium]|nr:outer membrane protein assembly factor [Campylobacterota bacterium]